MFGILIKFSITGIKHHDQTEFGEKMLQGGGSLMIPRHLAPK